MTIKTWVLGFEGEYEIDYYGNVFSWKNGEPKPIKSSFHPNGHRTIELQSAISHKRKKTYVHRIMWESFKKEELKRSDWIYHLDGDKTNNKITNLVKRSTKKEKNTECPSGEGIYRVVEEDGVEREFRNKTDIMSEYGLSYGKVNKGLKTGEWIVVTQKKNL